MPKFWNNLACAVCLSGVVSGAVFIAEPACAQGTLLEGIVVEGTSLDLTPESAASSGSAVTVVTGEELQEQQIRHAGDALRSLPGVHVGRTGAFSGLTEVRIRGGESNHAVVLIDGIEVNATTNGLFSFSDLTTENIERIEVIRGPQSGLYGSKAVSGVINIVTRTRRGPLQVTSRAEGGSFATDDASVTISGGDDRSYGSLTVHRRTSGGFNVSETGEEEDSSEFQSAFFKGGIKPFENLSLDVVLRKMGKDGERDDEGAGPGAFAVQVDSPSFFGTDQLTAGAEATLDTFGGNWVHKFKADANETRRKDTLVFGNFVNPSRNDSFTRRLRYLSTVYKDTPGFANSSHKLTGMVSRELEQFTPVTQDNVTRNLKRTAWAADYHGEYFDRLNVHAAARHDDNEPLEDFTTYRLAGSLDMPRTPLPLRAHASAGTGVKLPTMFERFGFIPALFVPNPDLVPEESFGWDAGVEVTLANGRAIVDVTYFDSELENKIETVSLGGGLQTAENLDGITRRKGVELTGSVQLNDRLEIGGAYTFLDTEDPDGLRLRRRPEHSGRVDANFRFAQGRGNLTASALYNGEMADFAFLFPSFEPRRVTLDDYWLFNLAGSYEVRQGVEVFGRVENMFDADYQEIFGFATAGAAAYAGVRVTLGGAEGARIAAAR